MGWLAAWFSAMGFLAHLSGSLVSGSGVAVTSGHEQGHRVHVCFWARLAGAAEFVEQVIELFVKGAGLHRVEV